MKIFASVIAVLLSAVSVLSVSKAIIDSSRHRVVVPKPVQVYGPDFGQNVPARTQMLYRINPFEEYYQHHRNFHHQSPVAFPYQGNAHSAQYQPSNFYPAAPQFIQVPGQQPMVYHPNVLSSPVQYSSGDPFNPQFVAGSRSELPEERRVSSFNRGHVEFHPQREQVQTYTSFRDNQEDDSGLMSRSAVESRPISAEAYSGIRSEEFIDEEDEWNPNPGLMDRSNVEAYPANLMRLADDNEKDPVNPTGYGSFGQAGFRAAVESPPIFTPQQDPSEAYPMLVKPNARPFGHLSESLLHTDQRSIDYSAADVIPYNSFYRPREQSMDPRYKLLCYYESWSNYRPSPQDFTIDRIDPHACTHLMYSFAGLDPDNYTISSLMPEYDVVAGGYKSIVALKARNPKLKVLIALGGWNEGGKKYSDMVTYPDLRKKFVSSAVKFVEENHFDGLDINWEYPGASDRGGRVTDKENFALLVQELSAEFRPKGFILSASVSPARFRVNEGYDVPTLADYLDFISVISYDLRGPWDGKADHNAPLRDRDVDTWAYRNLNVEDSMNYWVEKGADPSKLIMGIPFYGRTFTLENPAEYGTGARVSYAGMEGSYTREPGFLAYYEICANEKQGGWMIERDQAGGPFMVKGDQWIGYDDPDYIKLKMDHLRSKGYGGAMVWAIDLDDQLGICGSRWPLLTAVRQGLAYQEGGPVITTEEVRPEPQPEPEPKPEDKPTTVEESSENTSSTRDTTIATPTLAESSEPEPSGNTEGTKCSQDGETTGDSYNCQFYLQCNHGKYVSKDCGVGLHWNDVKKICDWPQNAGCKSSGVAPPVTPSSNGGMTGGSSGGITHPSVELEKITPSGQLSDDYMVVCYFTNWAWYRPGIGKYKPSDIDPSLCTHIVYGFAVLDYSTLKIKPHDTWADIDSGFYQKVTDLKQHGAKVTIAIGGWNDSEGDKYSRLVNSREARRRFIEHVLQFIEKYNFDGLDLDWEYPKCWQVNCDKGPASDKAAFALWIKELSEAFVPRGLLLSAAVSPSKKVIDAGYDVPACSKYLDWIAVMTYDYHGQWDKKTGHVAPSYYHPEDDYDYFNMDYTIRYWMEKGAAKNKLVLGMPMYGQSFTLNKASVNGLNAPARSGGTAGEFTRAKGFLAYYEICDRIMNRGWQVVKDPQGRMGPYAYKDNQWVSFDDVETIRSKSEYIRRMGLRGGMIWALDLDDFTNRCGQGAHPLLNTIKSVLGSPRGSNSIDDKGDKGPMGSSSGTGATIPTRVEPAVVSPPKVEVPTASTDIGPVRANDEYKVVCYFTNWAWYRQGEGKYLPGDIDASLCTHIVYGFAVLDASRLTIKPHDTWADFDNEFYKKVTALKSNKVKVLVAIGGWNDSRGSKYSKLVNSAEARRRFTDHVIEFMLKHNFDGLDLDWEYPKCWQVDCKKGPDSDKQAFAVWVRELHEAFKPHGLLLSAAVSPSNKVIDAGYDVPIVSKYLDWVAVMTYDYHGQWDKKTGHVAPMYMHPMDENPYFNTNYTIHYWIELGADPKKLILGMPMYGQSFTLAQSKDNGLNQKTYGGGEAGPYTRARGFLAYYEICHNILKKGWTVVRDEYQTMGPYARRGNQWVGFDDLDVIRYKSEYIRQMGLGGGMIWALDLDDFRDRCGCGKYPLLKTINSVLRNTQPVSCPVLGGGPPTKLLPFGSAPHDRITTTPRPTTLPPWMTTRKTTIPPWKTTRKTTIPPWQTTRKTTIPPWQTSRKPSVTRTKPTSAPAQITRTPEPDNVIGSECSVGEYRPHGGDCNKFYECDQGKLIERKCFPGLHWSAKQNRCDWPNKAKCDASSGSTGTGAATLPPVTAATTTIRTTTSWTSETSKPTVSTTRRPLPPASAPDDGYKVVCYFTNWAWYRRGIGKYKPSDIDYELCTHVVYGFAVLDGNKLVIKPHDRWADLDNDFYGKVTDLKRHGTKVLIAIGGWNDSLGSKYSRMVNDPTARANFVRHVTEFVLKHNFDGLDLDWEYPKCWQVDCKKGPESDKQAFSAWIRELHEAFQPHGLLLSAAVSPNPKVIDAGYEVPQLDRYLDWIAVMTYDYHGHWDKRTGHVAPMYHYSESQTPKFNADFTINYWIELGADPKKIIMGMPLYGQSFTLRDQGNNGYNVTASKGRAGQFTRAAGFLAYYEICHKVTREGYTVVKDPEGAIGPYAYKDRQWFSYDDVNMIRYKSEYVKRRGLGGAMIWALDLDDFKNRCGCEEHPLLRTINRVLRNYPVPDPNCQY